jgi:hypothetical protein
MPKRRARAREDARCRGKEPETGRDANDAHDERAAEHAAGDLASLRTKRSADRGSRVRSATLYIMTA